MNLKQSNIKLLPLLFLFMSSFIYAQESSFKIYANTFYLNSEGYPSPYDYTPEVFNYNGLTYAFRKVNSNDLIHQFETKIHFKNVDKTNEKLNRVDLHLRYELGKYIKKSADNRFKIQLSGAAKVYYLNEDIDNIFLNEFPLSNKSIGLNIALFTSIEFDLTEKIYLELGTSFLGISLDLNTRVFENPALTERQREFVSFEGGALNERILRLGVGYRFKK